MVLVLVCGGCAQTTPATVVQPARAPQFAVAQQAGTGIQLAQHTELPVPEELPSLRPPVPNHGAKILPINLDTIFRLAQDQNGQIQLAREQLNEAIANKAVADKAWLPEVDVGVSYYRHEGGIQAPDGELVHSSFGSLFAGTEIHGQLDLRQAVFQKIDAERKVWQQRGELSRLSSENLLDAANTYIDLLTARTSEKISLETEDRIRTILEKAKNLAAVEKGAQIEVATVQAQLAAQQQITREAQAGARSAAAKLIQILNLDPHAQLSVFDKRLVPFTLVPPNTPTDVLVDEALRNGPGVQEMEGLLALINDADAKSQGPGKYLPVFELRLAEGAFGAGPGDDMRWDNRFDVALQARWNLTNLVTAQDRQRVAHSRIAQAHLSHQNLRSKLTLGIQDAVEASASNADRITLAEKEIESSREAYKLSESRLANNIQGATPSQVLLAARTLAGAQLGLLARLREFDKAQIRLLILTGKVVTHPGH